MRGSPPHVRRVRAGAAVQQVRRDRRLDGEERGDAHVGDGAPELRVQRAEDVEALRACEND